MRDAQKDWELCQRFKPGTVVVFSDLPVVPIEKYFADEAQEALPYWIQRAMELEKALNMVSEFREKYRMALSMACDIIANYFGFNKCPYDREANSSLFIEDALKNLKKVSCIEKCRTRNRATCWYEYFLKEAKTDEQ